MKLVIRTSIFGVMALLAACVERSEGGTDPSGSADIVVTASGPDSPIASGKSAQFRIKVVNNGPDDATDVTIVDTIGVQSKLVAMSCTPTGKAVCPDPVGLQMKVPTLRNGDELDFLVTLELANLPTGIIIDSLVASYERDRDPNNNSIAIDAVVR